VRGEPAVQWRGEALHRDSEVFAQRAERSAPDSCLEAVALQAVVAREQGVKTFVERSGFNGIDGDAARARKHCEQLVVVFGVDFERLGRGFRRLGRSFSAAASQQDVDRVLKARNDDNAGSACCGGGGSCAVDARSVARRQHGKLVRN